MDIFKEIVSLDTNKNIIISPFSISDVLTILYYGANGETANQLKKYFKIIDSTKCISMKTLSKVYGRNTAPFKKIFLETIGENFSMVDFNSKNTLKDINESVKKYTNGKIYPLITSIPQDTCLIAISAVYFNAKWLHPFSVELTSKKDFMISENDTVEVDMMNLNDEIFNYGHFNKSFGSFSIIELPYIGNTSMVIILPDDINGLYDIEKNLTDEMFNNFYYDLISTSISVYIPKFKLSVEYNLENILSKMGLCDVFGPRGDFSNMCDSVVNINKFIHKVYIDVNEEYTEAAAATSVLMCDCANYKVFNANHPFMYVIRHLNGNILFIGRFVSPID
ncbi:serine protease inhibitor SPI-2/CrmA [Cotia virus SPAn232]|uniref:Serine protease inhibitor SPI-2/CrmA n=2 Tax=Cotia virus TaxID=39444 RepID=H6TAD3_9POXV|nr:serine protease inhibitor SPI-2/CrmA [Cotia virus SPAn232]AFB76967.1 serine protease inhibitor SPI-2/CrmA [Cotia virus SPAn232]AIT70780.1 serine protease inhibitor SPI-2/CrmA [Cotia virus]